MAGAPELTVVIPTHRGDGRIPPLLRALAAQSLARDRFEVLVVDNGSAGDSARRIEASSEFADLSRHGPARVLTIDTPGLTRARIEGVLGSRAPIVLFLDDDTEPESGCCRAALDAFCEVRVGVVFGRVYPKYRVPPPRWIQKREGVLAINDRLGDRPVVWKDPAEFAPTLGAALGVRKSAFMDAYPWREPWRLSSDRIGSQPISGGDLEIGQFLGAAGWWRAYEPRMIVRHVIDEARLEPAAFARLIVGIERSRATFEDKFGLGPRPVVRRLRASAEMAGIFALAPFWIVSADGYAGWRFALASRRGRWLGAYRGTVRPSRSSSTTIAGRRRESASP